jgi:DNA repair protein RadD
MACAVTPFVSLRPYQSQALDQVRECIRQKKRRIMLQIPTGGGKTLTGASMLAGALAKGSRSLFVAHRLELIDQTVSTFARIGITSIGVIRANDKRRAPEQPIQVASIQTLVRRSKPEAKIVFIDEAHRACAQSYLSLFEAYTDAIFVGLSATPARADGKPLGQLFDAMVHGATYSALIAEGFIVAPLVYSTPVLPDLSKVHTTSGDYNAEELEAAVNKAALIGNIVAEWQKRSDGRRTVIFAVSVAHSRAIVEQFRALGVSAEHLDGETPEDERRAILARLGSGATHVVSNVGVLCEGWDMPACKCLVLARPTKSLVLYMQMAGRILRPWQGVLPLILDHGGCVDRHGMPHEDREWSLSEKPKRSGSAPQKPCPECFAYIAAAMMECPHCGHVFPAPVGGEPEEKEALTGVELALRTLDGPDAQLSFFRSLVRQARDRSYRPGWAYHRYVEKFQVEPPREWLRAVKRSFGRDSEWSAQADARRPPTVNPSGL